MMRFKLLVAILIVAVVVGMIGFPVAFKDRDVPPQGLLYQTKRVGEWIDVNFLTFGAPEKQAKHQALASRRLQEFFDHPQQPLQINQQLAAAYEQELARAEFMAEQLALLDYTFISAIEAVYTQTLADYQRLLTADYESARGFRTVAFAYNQYAIKTLLHKHQHTPQLTIGYKKLIQDRADWLQTQQSRLNEEQRQKLMLAHKVLQEGKELEWAYDILASIP